MMNDAEKERIQLVLSQLSASCYERRASFVSVTVALMEVAAQYTDMNGPQKRALVQAAMEEIVRRHVPAFEPFLPLVGGICDKMVKASQKQFQFRAQRGAAACFPCCRSI